MCVDMRKYCEEQLVPTLMQRIPSLDRPYWWGDFLCINIWGMEESRSGRASDDGISVIVYDVISDKKVFRVSLDIASEGCSVTNNTEQWVTEEFLICLVEFLYND